MENLLEYNDDFEYCVEALKDEILYMTDYIQANTYDFIIQCLLLLRWECGMRDQHDIYNNMVRRMQKKLVRVNFWDRFVILPQLRMLTNEGNKADWYLPPSNQ